MTKRILVVEDREDNRQILRDLLGNTGYELVEALDGVQALAAVAKQRPDLILMDIQLPIMDGYEATRRIKAAPAVDVARGKAYDCRSCYSPQFPFLRCPVAFRAGEMRSHVFKTPCSRGCILSRPD